MSEIITNKIKVFTSNYGAKDAGDNLTQQIEDWKTKVNQETKKLVRIEKMHTNSNKYGWMVTLLYTVY